jgi:hypothetical protein
MINRFAMFAQDKPTGASSLAAALDIQHAVGNV